MNATTRSSRATMLAGASPATILQKMQPTDALTASPPPAGGGRRAARAPPRLPTRPSRARPASASSCLLGRGGLQVEEAGHLLVEPPAVGRHERLEAVVVHDDRLLLLPVP